MENKGKCFKPILELLTEWHNDQIKQFNIRFEELKTMVGDYKLVLNINEARLERLLREGKSG